MAKYSNLRDFVERAPLYTRMRENLPLTRNAFRVDVLDQYCPICAADRTFREPSSDSAPTPQRGPGLGGSPTLPFDDMGMGSGIYLLAYRCTACLRGDFRVWIEVHSEQADLGAGIKGPRPVWLRKVGQVPPWGVRPEKELQRTLGDYTELFSKGWACESQGYGIGAYAYYRRIIENIIDSLLASIAGLLADAERATYEAALAQLATTYVAKEKIAVVKDLLPGNLRPSGVNPLGVLHTALSEGIHASDDEQCLELAADIREAIQFLATEIAVHKRSAARFTSAMQRLLEKRSSE